MVSLPVMHVAFMQLAALYLLLLGPEASMACSRRCSQLSSNWASVCSPLVTLHVKFRYIGAIFACGTCHSRA